MTDTPWDDIHTPDASYNVLREGESPAAVPLYWGRDVEGRYLFIVSLAGDHSEHIKGRVPSIRGIDVALRSSEVPEEQRLVLTLEQSTDGDLFAGLCRTLISSLQEVSSASSALDVALAHLARWKTFLSGRNPRVLSAEEVRGLFAELQFLRRLYRGEMPEAAALDAWCGPDRSQQDFVHGNTAVEIKAISGQERNSINISSEDQLETTCENLFLAVYRLGDMPGDEQAMSLNGLVAAMEEELGAAGVLDNFLAKLGSCGYVRLDEYDRPQLIVMDRQLFRVTDDFPRIVRSQLADGLTAVRYQIQLERMARFACEEEDVPVP